MSPPIGPPKGITVGELNAATPTPFDSTTLKKQLGNIGLDCAQLNDKNLSSYIDEVDSQLQDGNVKSMAIKMPVGNHQNVLQTASELSELSVAVPALTDAATGNWTINSFAEGYAPNLEVIQYPTHFDWLYDNRGTNGFTGVKDVPQVKTGYYENAEAIKKLFIDVGLTASASLVSGLDKPTMKATLTNVIAPLKDDGIANYFDASSRSIFLVENYDPKTKIADGIGVLNIAWSLLIEDYKRKTKDGGDTHSVVLMVWARSVLYSDTSVLCADYNNILDHFQISKSSAPSCRI